MTSSVVLGTARTRTIWLILPATSHSAVITIITALNLVALILESVEKKSSHASQGSHGEQVSSPEPYSGFWTRTCFTWLLATFRLGYSKILSLDALPVLDAKLESRLLHEQVDSTWAKCRLKSTKHNGNDNRTNLSMLPDGSKKRHSLLRACLRAYLPSVISPILPRICLTIFTFSQIYLINSTVSFVGRVDPDSNYGKGLIGAWAAGLLFTWA